MKISFNEKLRFYKEALKNNAGPLFVGFLFISIGLLLMYIGYFITTNRFVIGLGLTFISFSGSFLIYTMPSSITHDYDQEVIKKYGIHTTAKVTNKYIEDYSHTSNTFEDGKAVHHEEFLYAVGFEFKYNEIIYCSESFFEQKETYETILVGSEIPIQFLRHDPNTMKIRRRKLSNELGISEKLCQ